MAPTTRKKLRIKLGATTVSMDGFDIVVPWIEEIKFCSNEMARLWGGRIKLAVHLDHENGEVVAKPFVALEREDVESAAIFMYYESPFMSPDKIFLEVSPFTGGDVEISALDIGAYTNLDELGTLLVDADAEVDYHEDLEDEDDALELDDVDQPVAEDATEVDDDDDDDDEDFDFEDDDFDDDGTEYAEGDDEDFEDEEVGDEEEVEA